MYLPLANLTHHKLGTALNALGIGIGICMLVTLSGLSRGSLYEVAQRWEAVDADLFAYPQIWSQNVSSLSGVGLPDRYGDVMIQRHGELIERIVPVFLWRAGLAGQDQLTAGVDAGDFAALTGGRKIVEGRVFDPDGRFAEWIEGRLLAPAEDDDAAPIDITEAELSAEGRSGLEIVIDERLARAGQLAVGQTVEMVHHRFRIVGIVETGGMSRVYLPRRTAQYLFGGGDLTKSTLLMIKLRGGVDAGEAARRLTGMGLEVVQISQFRHMLEHQFGIMFVYVDAVNVVALVIAFLFIMITLYTMVLRRQRDIAILKSSGASRAFIVRQVLAESLILTAAGLVVGLGLSVLAGRLIEAFRPLLTVEFNWGWVGIAAAAATVGAGLSALYPAWRATRVDMLEALTLE